MDWLNHIITDLLPYKGYIVMGFAWFAHVYIPHIIRIYPWVSANGGVFGITKAFFVGKPDKATENKPTTTTTPQG